MKKTVHREIKMQSRLSLSLFLLRLTIFLVMFVWTLDKFVNVEHTKKVWSNFYLMNNLSNGFLYFVGGVQLAIILLFLLGLKKKFSYTIVFLLHFISTFSSYKQYLSPFEGANLLFFAAWPMLAGSLALVLLKDEDNFLTLK